jgi:hypothetical protein
MDNSVDSLLSIEERMKKLIMQKKKNGSKLKKITRSFAKAKLEKKKINNDIRRLKDEWDSLVKANPCKANEEFAKIVQSVTNDQIFPKDLEKEFNDIDHQYLMGKKKKITVEDLSDDAELVPINVSEALEKELDSELDDVDTKSKEETEPEEPDEETKQMLGGELEVGFSGTDIYIDEDGNETEESR